MTEVTIKRVYDPEEAGDGFRVLVDRLWPRGMRREALHYDLWAKELAPSAPLRIWFHADPQARWTEFERRYTDELKHSAALHDFLEHIRGQKHLTLLYASKNAAENHAQILRRVIAQQLEAAARDAMPSF